MEGQKRWVSWLIAAVVVGVAAAALAMTNRATAQPPENTTAQGVPPLLAELFPDASDFEPLPKAETNETLVFAYVAKKDGAVLGHGLGSTVQGYGGPIELTVGINADQTLRALRVGGRDFAETEGLGAKAKDPAFTDQFQGKRLPVVLGNGIDGIAGATVTSRAVTDGVNAAAAQLQTLLSGGVPSPSVPANGERTANASALGYGGPVLVRLTLDEAGTITAIDVGGVRFAETEGVGSRVRDEAFLSQFIGQRPPLSMESGIDAAAGATVSSQAVVDAVNDAAQFLMQK